MEQIRCTRAGAGAGFDHLFYVTVAGNWASCSGKLAVYSSFTMHMYSGLKDWLYWVGVPVGSPRCECRWPRQTPKHVILLCTLRTNREAMLSVAGTENYNTLLSTQKGLKAVT